MCAFSKFKVLTGGLIPWTGLWVRITFEIWKTKRAKAKHLRFEEMVQSEMEMIIAFSNKL